MNSPNGRWPFFFDCSYGIEWFHGLELIIRDQQISGNCPSCQDQLSFDLLFRYVPDST